MTILTIETNKTKTRIHFPSPMWINGIQFIDHHFHTFHNVFTVDQTVERNGTPLVTFTKGVPYTFLDIIATLNHGIVGINIHHLGNRIHIVNTVARSLLVFSDELRSVLNVCRLLPLGVNYCTSETQNNYHVSIKGMVLGLITRNEKAVPSNLLVTLPSKSSFFPIHMVERKLYNYLDLEITTHEGKDVNFHDKPFRIVLNIEDR